MAKVKILKKLPKGKMPSKKPTTHKTVSQPTNKFTDKYLEFYDDIKIPSRKYHW